MNTISSVGQKVYSELNSSYLQFNRVTGPQARQEIDKDPGFHYLWYSQTTDFLLNCRYLLP